MATVYKKNFLTDSDYLDQTFEARKIPMLTQEGRFGYKLRAANDLNIQKIPNSNTKYE
jgi:hypothetical protein